MSLLREYDPDYLNYSTFGTFSAPDTHGPHYALAHRSVNPVVLQAALLLVTGGSALQFADNWRFRGSDTDFTIQQLVGGTWTDRVLGVNTPAPAPEAPAPKAPVPEDGNYLFDAAAHIPTVDDEHHAEAIAQANDACLFAQTIANAAAGRNLTAVNQANASEAIYTLAAFQAEADQAEWQAAFDTSTTARVLAAASGATELQVLASSEAQVTEARAANTRDISEAAAKSALLQKSVDAAARDIYTTAAERAALNATQADDALNNLLKVHRSTDHFFSAPLLKPP